MPDSDQNMTRYLLGELSELERSTLELQYFDDPQVFEQVLRSENELVDQYVRGNLSADTRRRFEQIYLTDPKLRERVKFAEALVARIDQQQSTEVLARKPVGIVSGWRRLMALSGPRPILQFSLALASLLLVVGSVWFFIESRRASQELVRSQSARSEQEARARELETQIAAERKRNDELNARLDHKQIQQPPAVQPSPTPRPTDRTQPAFASLVFTVGGVRAGETGPPLTLVIPDGTTEARLQLNLKEHDYTGYRASLKGVGGAEIFSRAGLKPRTTKSGATLTLIVPARKFASGDYILTLSGISKDGEIEELSKSIFRVEKR
jgi:anti-sigma factor RsiW